MNFSIVFIPAAGMPLLLQGILMACMALAGGEAGFAL